MSRRFRLKIFSQITLLLFLLATPVMAGAAPSFDGGVLIASANEGNSSQEAPSGRIVIKGKGGKVTDVEQKPGHDKKKDKDKKHN